MNILLFYFSDASLLLMTNSSISVAILFFVSLFRVFPSFLCLSLSPSVS